VVGQVQQVGGQVVGFVERTIGEVWGQRAGVAIEGTQRGDEAIHGRVQRLAGGDVRRSGDRLAASLRAFDAHTGALAPHFAYGALDKPDYLRAHLMHLANHWQEMAA